MPAWAKTSAAHSCPARGSTVSRSADIVGSDRMAVPLTHATGRAGLRRRPRSQHHGARAVPDGHVSA